MSFDMDTFKDVWDELNGLEEHFDCSKMDEIEEEHGALLEMAEIGEFQSYKISVFTNEGNIPHFHIYDKQTKRKICLQIGKADYFKHGKYQNELMRDERKTIQEWLSLPNEDAWQDRREVSSNYREICIEWNRNNRDNRVDVNQPIPDYIHMR